MFISIIKQYKMSYTRLLNTLNIYLYSLKDQKNSLNNVSSKTNFKNLQVKTNKLSLIIYLTIYLNPWLSGTSNNLVLQPAHISP